MGTLQRFINSVEKDIGAARALCPAALQDYLHITRGMNQLQKDRVEIVERLIGNTERGQFRSVYAQLRAAQDAFRLHIMPLLPKDGSVASHRDVTSHEGRPLAAKRRVHSDIDRQYTTKEAMTGHISDRSVAAVAPVRQHFDHYVFDDYDMHRPTKTAEKFLELYEHEWRDAFTEIGEQVRVDKRNIEILLEVVQTAYRQNQAEAEQQIDKMESAVFDIVAGQNVRPTERRHHPDRNMLVQHRKVVAGYALDRLRKDFIDDAIRRVFSYHRISCGPRSQKFAGLCAEITWWMVVQDPPIHMVVPQKGDHIDGQLFTAHNFSGRIVDYTVWPALLLHRNGPVLARGIVQAQ